MNILFLNSLYTPHVGGGAEVILQRTVEGLARRDVKVSVLVTGADAGLSEESLNRVRVYRAGLRNFYWHYNDQRPGPLLRLGWHLRDRYNTAMRGYVREVIERVRPDLVVCHNLTGWSVSAWDEISAAGLPIVQVLHDYYLLCPASSMFNKGHACQQQCNRCRRLRQGHAQHSAQVTSVVAVSRFLLDTLQGQGYFPGAHREVVYNASPFQPAPLKSIAPTPGKTPLRFGYMGTLSAAKGLEWLIEQFQRLPFEATLQIAGRGQSKDELRFQAMVASPRIQFVGYQSPQAFYSQIDVAIVPSLWNEPFGMVAVEACAHGVPVIASRMGGLPEIIRHEHNGLLCSPDDRDALGVAMLRLHQQPGLLAQLTRQAHNSVSTFLDLERMLDSYQRIFRQALLDRDRLPRLLPLA